MRTSPIYPVFAAFVPIHVISPVGSDLPIRVAGIPQGQILAKLIGQSPFHGEGIAWTRRPVFHRGIGFLGIQKRGRNFTAFIKPAGSTQLGVKAPEAIDVV